MSEYEILKGFYKYRLENKLVELLLKNSEYQEATLEAQNYFEQLEEAKMTIEQVHSVDRVVGAYNHLGNVYGEEAYKLGFWDGIQLMVLINKVADR